MADTYPQRIIDQPGVQFSIAKKLEESGLKLDTVSKSFRRNIVQNKNLTVSRDSIRDYFEITGHLNKNNDKATNQVAIIIDR